MSRMRIATPLVALLAVASAAWLTLQPVDAAEYPFMHLTGDDLRVSQLPVPVPVPEPVCEPGSLALRSAGLAGNARLLSRRA